MENKRNKRVWAFFLMLIITVTSIPTLAINVKAEYSFRHEDVTDFKSTVNGKVAGYLSIDDRYYANSRCLYIRDRVDYVPNVASTPYNLTLVVSYYIHSVGLESMQIDEIEVTAYIDGYVLNENVQAQFPRTVYLVILDHDLNMLNNVSQYTRASLRTEFTVD